MCQPDASEKSINYVRSESVMTGQFEVSEESIMKNQVVEGHLVMGWVQKLLNDESHLVISRVQKSFNVENPLIISMAFIL